MKIKQIIVTAILALAIPVLAAGQDVTAPYGVIPDGYDPVAYKTEDKAVRGKVKFNHVHNGKSYIFATRQNRDRFILEPGKYVWTIRAAGQTL